MASTFEPYSADELESFADDVAEYLNEWPSPPRTVVEKMLPVILRALADLVRRGER